MNIEELKHEFIKLKIEELTYINSIYMSSNRVFSSQEKVLMYRKLNDYKNRLDEMLKKIFDYIKT